jgi:heptaprenyl diphosphate synthase
MEKNSFSTQRLARLGLMTATAMILGYVESLIPFFPGVPGIKLGLPNLVTVWLLWMGTAREALAVSVMRILLTGFLFGNLYSILFSLAGGLLSLGAMAILRKREDFSIYGVSILGGVCHNIGQLLVAVLVVETYRLAWYLPVLLVAGMATGAAIGIVSGIMVRRLAFLWK